MLNSVEVISNPYDVEIRLNELFGFGQVVLIRAIFDGFIKRNEATGNHPKTYGGTCHYAEGTAILREQLIPAGWDVYSRSNSDWILEKNLKIMINFMVGNNAVGTLDTINSTNSTPLKKQKNPTNKNPKGSMFAEIAKGQLQRTGLIPFSLNRDTSCWALMYYIDRKNSTIRAEISFPSSLTQNGKYFASYYERIILSEIPIDSDSYEIQPTHQDNPPEIDFEIKRKA